VKELYILATLQAEPIPTDDIQDAFASNEVEVHLGESGTLCSLASPDSRIDVRFETRDSSLGWTPELITGTEEAKTLLRNARGFYRISFEPGKPHTSVAVFEALWCARAILERVEGVLLDVSAFKLQTSSDVEEMTELDFDIRDHITLHAVDAAQTQTPVWVHSHGMEKFGTRNVEIYHLGEQDLQAAETFLHEICTDLAFGRGPAPRAAVETSSGQAFCLAPSEEARLNLFGFSADAFDGHEGAFWTLVSPSGRHNMMELLKPYREHFQKESEDEAAALARTAMEFLPTFKSRFQRKGLMEPLTFLVRAPFESHPGGEASVENLWLEVVTWGDTIILGKLIDGGKLTTEWRRGAQVEIDEADINALALSRDGESLDAEEMSTLLFSELPS